MRERDPARLFLRWREEGDAEALGRVFDAAAPELLRVAVALVRDAGEAEDLLQGSPRPPPGRARARGSRPCSEDSP